MPIVVPGQRNLNLETFTTYLEGLRENRRLEEERERQEAAAEAQGNTALASGAGAILGAVLAIPTGGLSIAAGAALGGGLGKAAGGIAFGDDAPPGFQNAAIGQGLSQAAQGIILQYKIQADESIKAEEKELAFKEYLVGIAGPEGPKGFDQFEEGMVKAAADAGQPKPTKTMVANAFLDKRGASLQQTMTDHETGVFMAKRKGLADFKALQAFKAAPIHPPEHPFAGLPKGYDYSPVQAMDMQATKHAIDSLNTQINKSTKPEPELQESLAQQRSIWNRQALQVKRTPQIPTTVSGYRNKGIPLPVNTFVPFEEGGKTGLTMSSGGASSFVSNNGTVTDPGSSITWGVETKTGKRFFKSMKLPDGRVIFQNTPFVHPSFPEAGAKYFDSDGKLQDYDTTKAGEDPRTEFVSMGVEAFIKSATTAGAPIDIAKVLEISKKFGDAFDEQTEELNASKLQKDFSDVTSARRIIQKMEDRDPKFKQALEIFVNPGKFIIDDAGRREAGRYAVGKIKALDNAGILTPEIKQELEPIIRLLLSEKESADTRNRLP